MKSQKNYYCQKKHGTSFLEKWHALMFTINNKYILYFYTMKSLLIGYGYWGKIIESKLKEITLLQGIIKSDDNVDNILNVTNVDIVFICTPTSTHYDLVKKCIKYNIKIIFCEKPFTCDYMKATELILLAKQNNVNIFIDNIFLYRTEFMNLKKKNHKNIMFLWQKNEIVKEGQYKENIINTLLYHDIYLLIKITNNYEWLIKKKCICDTKLYLELYSNESKTAIIEYDRKNITTLKKIYLDNEIVDFSLPQNDPLFDIIYGLKLGKIDFDDNNNLTIKTLSILDKIISYTN
jgi:hypothetical protein